VADFIKGLDSFVKTHNEKVTVDGRLITISAFSLAPGSEGGIANLTAHFSVTTYVTPPGLGLTAGATPTAPPATGAPAAASIGGTP
jgi:hypothetical protein